MKALIVLAELVEIAYHGVSAWVAFKYQRDLDTENLALKSVVEAQQAHIDERAEAFEKQKRQMKRLRSRLRYYEGEREERDADQGPR